MPTVEFRTRELVELLQSPLPLSELREKMPMLGVSLEHMDEEKLVVEIFPNRPDMLSIEGFARALRGFLGIEKGMAEYTLTDSGIVLSVEPSVKEIRPYVVAGVVRNVNIDEETLISLMNVQEQLHKTHGRNRVKVAIGVHDLDKVTPPFTYKAVKPESISFVPLDMDKKLNLREILRQHPKGREYAFTLNGKSKYPIIIDAEGEVLSFPPIINGELTRVTEKTKNLFLELTGTSILALEQALNILVTSIAERRGEIQTVTLEYKAE